MITIEAFETTTCTDPTQEKEYITYETNDLNWIEESTSTSSYEDDWDNSTNATDAAKEDIKTLKYCITVESKPEKEIEIDEEELAYLREIEYLKRLKELGYLGRKAFFSPPKPKMQHSYNAGFHRRICTQSCPRQNWKSYKKEGL